jgi:hypothetical protein
MDSLKYIRRGLHCDAETQAQNHRKYKINPDIEEKAWSVSFVATEENVNLVRERLALKTKEIISRRHNWYRVTAAPHRRQPPAQQPCLALADSQ